MTIRRRTLWFCPILAVLVTGLAACAPPAAPGRALSPYTPAELQEARRVLERFLQARAEGDVAAQYALISAASRSRVTAADFAGMRAEETEPFRYTAVGTPTAEQGFVRIPVTVGPTRDTPEIAVPYALTRDPDGWRVAWTDSLVAAADNALDEGDLDTALSILEEALAVNPFDQYAHYLSAVVYLNQPVPDGERALRSINRAIRLAPDFWFFYPLRGFIHATLRGDLRQARRDYEHGLRLAAAWQLDPTWEAWVRLQYAEVLLGVGEVELAQDQARTALALDPDNAELRAAAGRFGG